jgi:hypothetical protein
MKDQEGAELTMPTPTNKNNSNFNKRLCFVKDGAASFTTKATTPTELTAKTLFFREMQNHARDTISEEQLARVLSPVQQMIEQGAFCKRRVLGRTAKIASALTAAALCAATLTAVVVLQQNPIPQASVPGYVVIPGTPIPLATVSTMNAFYGYMQLPAASSTDARYVLVCESCSEYFELGQRQQDGTHALMGIPFGSYAVVAQATCADAPQELQYLARLTVMEGCLTLLPYSTDDN